MTRLLAHLVALILFVFITFPLGVLLAFLSGAVGCLILYAHNGTTEGAWVGVREDVKNLWMILLFLLGKSDDL